MKWYIVLCIILFVGAFGGVFNPFNPCALDRFKAVLNSASIGIMGAVIIPLYLHVISSDLMLEVENATINYFVFAGYCLIASIFSKKLLNILGQFFLKKRL